MTYQESSSGQFDYVKPRFEDSYIKPTKAFSLLSAVWTNLGDKGLFLALLVVNCACFCRRYSASFSSILSLKGPYIKLQAWASNCWSEFYKRLFFFENCRLRYSHFGHTVNDSKIKSLLSSHEIITFFLRVNFVFWTKQVWNLTLS